MVNIWIVLLYSSISLHDFNKLLYQEPTNPPAPQIVLF